MTCTYDTFTIDKTICIFRKIESDVCKKCFCNKEVNDRYWETVKPFTDEKRPPDYYFNWFDYEREMQSKRPAPVVQMYLDCKNGQEVMF